MEIILNQLKQAVLYATFMDESLYSGYMNKIHSQCKAIAKIGYCVYLQVVHKNDVFFYKCTDIECFILERYKFSSKRISSKRNIIDEFFLFKKYIRVLKKNVKEKSVKILYFRRIIPITLSLIKMLAFFNKKKLKVIYEYPTYPWKKEYLAEKKYLFYLIDTFLFKYLYRKIDYFVAVGVNPNEYPNFISISNAIDTYRINLRKMNSITDKINLIGVANVNKFHGYDRLIEGLKNYYYTNTIEKKEVNFYIVGNGNELENLKKMVIKYKLEKYVTFTDYLSGVELDNLFNLSHLAIGCLGVHRKNINNLNSLKNREYCARGIPFIFAEKDFNIENHMPTFIHKVPASDAPIDISDLINFYLSRKFSPKKIRKFAEDYLDWKSQMKLIFSKVD